MANLNKLSLIITSIIASSSAFADNSKNETDILLTCNAFKSDSHFYLLDGEASDLKQGLWVTGETSAPFECQRAEKPALPPFPDQNVALWSCTESGVDKDARTLEISYHGFSGWTVGYLFEDNALIDAIVCPVL